MTTLGYLGVACTAGAVVAGFIAMRAAGNAQLRQDIEHARASGLEARLSLLADYARERRAARERTGSRRGWFEQKMEASIREHVRSAEQLLDRLAVLESPGSRSELSARAHVRRRIEWHLYRAESAQQHLKMLEPVMRQKMQRIGGQLYKLWRTTIARESLLDASHMRQWSLQAHTEQLASAMRTGAASSSQPADSGAVPKTFHPTQPVVPVLERDGAVRAAAPAERHSAGILVPELIDLPGSVMWVQHTGMHEDPAPAADRVLAARGPALRDSADAYLGHARASTTPCAALDQAATTARGSAPAGHALSADSDFAQGRCTGEKLSPHIKAHDRQRLPLLELDGLGEDAMGVTLWPSVPAASTRTGVPRKDAKVLLDAEPPAPSNARMHADQAIKPIWLDLGDPGKPADSRAKVA